MKPDNNRIITINMSDTEDINQATAYINAGREAGFEVVQRNLIFDKEGSLWAVVWLEIPAESKDEPQPININCSCAVPNSVSAGATEFIPVPSDRRRVYTVNTTLRNSAPTVERAAASDADTEPIAPTTLPDDQ